MLRETSPCLSPSYQSLKTDVGTFCLELKQTKMNSDHNCVKSTVKNRWISECFSDRLKDDFVNPQHPQNMRYTLDFHLAKDLVTIMYGAFPLSAWAVFCQGVHISIHMQPHWGKLCCLAWMFPSLFIFKCVFEYWILGNFLLLYQELCHCPKNLLKKQVQIWEESISFLLYKFT